MGLNQYTKSKIREDPWTQWSVGDKEVDRCMRLTEISERSLRAVGLISTSQPGLLPAALW